MKSSSLPGMNIKSSEALQDVRYEIRGQLANHALELEKRGYEVVSAIPDCLVFARQRRCAWR